MHWLRRQTRGRGSRWVAAMGKAKSQQGWVPRSEVLHSFLPRRWWCTRRALCDGPPGRKWALEHPAASGGAVHCVVLPSSWGWPSTAPAASWWHVAVEKSCPTMASAGLETLLRQNERRPLQHWCFQLQGLTPPVRVQLMGSCGSLVKWQMSVIVLLQVIHLAYGVISGFCTLKLASQPEISNLK